MARHRKTDKETGIPPEELEFFFVINCSNGKSSKELETVPDVAMWVEDNLDMKTRKATIIRRARRSRIFQIAEVESQIEKLSAKVDELKARERLLKNPVPVSNDDPGTDKTPM